MFKISRANTEVNLLKFLIKKILFKLLFILLFFLPNFINIFNLNNLIRLSLFIKNLFNLLFVLMLKITLFFFMRDLSRNFRSSVILFLLWLNKGELICYFSFCFGNIIFTLSPEDLLEFVD